MASFISLRTLFTCLHIRPVGIGNWDDLMSLIFLWNLLSIKVSVLIHSQNMQITFPRRTGHWTSLVGSDKGGSNALKTLTLYTCSWLHLLRSVASNPCSFLEEESLPKVHKHSQICISIISNTGLISKNTRFNIPTSIRNATTILATILTTTIVPSPPQIRIRTPFLPNLSTASTQAGIVYESVGG